MNDISVSNDGPITTVTLSAPERRNALDVAMLHELEAALAAAASGSTTAIVLAGEGTTFCAGADLKLIAAALDGDPAAALSPLVDAVAAVVMRLDALEVPTICALEGTAVGAGMALALATDLRVVAEDAKLITGFFAIGASPDSGASYLLARSLGRARALSVVLRNEVIDAVRMSAWGLTDDVVAPGSATAEAQTLAAGIGALPAAPLVAFRTLLDSGDRLSLSDQLDAEKAAIEQMWATADFAEGIAAFSERRRPNFGGR